MILLLVIALLVLLALMGTVFILMASADRKSAYASNSSASLNMAQQGVLNTVRGLMLNATIDQNGQTLAVGSYNTTTHVYSPDTYSAGPPGTTGQIARYWDYPEVGAMPSGSTPAQFYQTVTAAGASVTTPTQYAASEPWLVSNQPYEPGNFYAPGEEVFYYTAAGTRWVYVGPANSTTPPGPPSSANTTYWQPVATPAAGYCGASGTATTTIPLISTFSPYLYDPGPTGTYGGTTFNGGSYDIPWQVGGAGAYPVPVPNASVVEPRWAVNTANNPPLAPAGTLDAMWNLLPYSDPNGTRYRFAVRIVDTSSLLNLNTGWIANAYTSSGSNTAEASDPYGIYGAFIASAPILNQPGLNIDPTEFTNAATGTPVQIGGGPAGTTPGRIGKYPNGTTFYSLPVWQDALSEYELQFPSSGPPSYTYPTAPPAAFATSLFGTNSAMDLLTGAGAGGMAFGSPMFSRVASLMPNTLGLEANYFGSGYRNLYTTYSFGRDVAPINPGTSSAGTAPPKVNLNAPLSSSNLGTISTGLYNVMTAAGFSPQHALSFVANYLTYRDDPTGYSTAPAYISTSGAVTVGALAGTMTGITPATNFVGTTAQPFLNEVDVNLQPQPGGAAPTVVDWAIEVANPFPTALGNTLPMSNGTSPNYTITVTSSTGGTLVIPLAGTKKVNPSLAGFNIGANTYLGVVCASGGGYDTIASKLGDGFVYPVSTSGGTFPAPAAAGSVYTITLTRDNLPGGATAVVDSMTLTVPGGIVPDANNDPVYADASRDNGGPSDGIWGCDSSGQSNASGTLSVTDPGTIGKNNGLVTVAGGGPGVPLYDRFFSGYNTTATPFLSAATLDSNDDLVNIDDLNCIARESSTSASPLTGQIGANVAATSSSAVATPPANLGMYYVTEAQTAKDPVIQPSGGATISPELLESALYFDFAYDPRAAYTAADASFGDPQVTVLGEIPPTFLSCTTLTDRSQSNTTARIALPEGIADLVRQAGKININTAGPDVLYSAFSEDGALRKTIATPPAPTDIDQLLVDAIGFRDRLKQGATVPPVPVALTVPAGYTVGGGSGYTSFGGVGYQSTADLLVAFIPTIESGTFPTVLKTTPSTIQQRDAAWADVENFLTVRSDTFAVYGLVQALRLNPAYTAASGAYSPTDWYNANQGIVVGTGTVYNEGSISTDPTNPNAEFILEGSRRFIAIVDRSYCNNGATVQPHIVALKILPQ